MLKRLQHPAFGIEIRKLLRSNRRQESELAGIVVNELDTLTDAKRRGEAHPNEQHLHGGGLDGIHYLKLYKSNESIRVYFIVEVGNLWMLRLESGKRRTNLNSGTGKMLLERRRDVFELAKSKGKP